ncbi:hypothetical protein M422DRAFT_150962 [Sphaerobolus stellatus SS14]|nr:hypothetical protein M422DRAFT_150962 [Sphaerobolus stellatus SS14]
MGEVVNVVVAFAVIVFIVRWAMGGGNNEADRARNLLGFRPKRVTDDMISTVQSMFPDIPRDNIRYDLLRTGSVEVTSNKLLERGFLEPPPRGYHELYPVQPATAARLAENAPLAANAASSSSAANANLIERFHLEQHLKSENALTSAVDPGGKAVWEDTAERREASLRERKAQMVLAARK